MIAIWIDYGATLGRAKEKWGMGGAEHLQDKNIPPVRKLCPDLSNRLLGIAQ